MAEKMTSNWERVEEIVERIKRELRNFENLINDPDQPARHEAVDLVDGPRVPVLEPIREKEISHLNKMDGPGLEDQQRQSSLLTRAHEKLEKLMQTADRKFISVLESLEAAEAAATKANEKLVIFKNH